MVKIGVIGVGRMGQRHCRVYSNLRKVQLVGIYDCDPQRGEEVAGQFEVAYYAKLATLLRQVDAVSIATPTQFHYEQARQCLSAGVHALVEKPITASPAEAQELAAAARDSNLVIQVGHIERFNPAYLELKNVFAASRPLAINIRRLSPYQGSNVDIDVVLDLMIHDTNLVLDLLGSSPESFTATGLTVYSNSIDHAVAQLTFPGGPLLTMTASRITEHKVRRIEIAAQSAYLECDLLNKTLSIHRQTRGEYLIAQQKGVKYRQESVVEWISVPPFEPLLLQLQHFINCILEGTQPVVSAQDGWQALQLALDIRARIQSSLIRIEAPANTASQ